MLLERKNSPRYFIVVEWSCSKESYLRSATGRYKFHVTFRKILSHYQKFWSCDQIISLWIDAARTESTSWWAWLVRIFSLGSLSGLSRRVGVFNLWYFYCLFHSWTCSALCFYTLLQGRKPLLWKVIRHPLSADTPKTFFNCKKSRHIWFWSKIYRFRPCILLTRKDLFQLKWNKQIACY